MRDKVKPLKNATALLKNPDYQSLLQRLETLESTRIFCKHDLAHFLDVARIASLLSAERGLPMSRDVIYVTALLHDIGRVKQYEDGTPHEQASLALAGPLLDALDFSDEERSVIERAIADHRRVSSSDFSRLFSEADKASRVCYACSARSECNWPDENKNLAIYY